ncbi:MAG: ribose 5-phosphate isomerase B [Spirochaetaceae bacterium 4572_59]|nr:MAG: ribose 5-phosphate isomerase B [Spirochaetaceae bacterium 4572_59]
MSKKVVMANDHGAVELKEEVKTFLKGAGYEVCDLGVAAEEAADYPDQAEKASKEYLKGGYEFGIVMCGTGIGISMAANKMDGIRCALPQNLFAAEMSKVHNDANFISFGGRIVYGDSVVEMVKVFMESEYEGGRHARRVEKIMNLEN